MSTMKQIYVALEHAGETLPVGVLRFDSSQRFGYFTYVATYKGPPLDPINLDYRKPVDPRDRFRRGERMFVVDVGANPGLMHQVFVDAMPGGWGMAVLQAEYPEIRQMKDAERLHWMGARTSGALSFFVERREDEEPVRGLEQLEIVRKKCDEFMEKLEKMGLAGARNPAVASHGGVMPKASYEDANGRHWIAKFDRHGDGTQGCVLEHTACEMARKCGITVPATKAMPDGSGGHMFLSERYDRGAQERNHKISFMSLTGAADASAGDYRDIFRVLKEITDPVAWPAQRDEMLRRLAFIIGLNITDDHLRNHEVRLLANGSWELSPAFDLMPVSGAAPHQTAVFGQARANINLDLAPTKALWTSIAQELGAEPAHVLGIVGKVSATIASEWPALVASTGLNRFNQMSALMAAEVGCKVPFPELAKALTPLDTQGYADLVRAGSTLNQALAMLKGEAYPNGADLQVSRALMALYEEVPRLAHLLRGAGHQTASELLMMAPLKNAARAVLESRKGIDPSLWRDIEDAASSLSGVTTKASESPRPRAKNAPR